MSILYTTLFRRFYVHPFPRPSRRGVVTFRDSGIRGGRDVGKYYCFFVRG